MGMFFETSQQGTGFAHSRRSFGRDGAAQAWLPAGCVVRDHPIHCLGGRQACPAPLHQL
jgi:hypothetical protein